MATTYRIKNMRVVRISGKIAEKHPDRIFTVYGEFYREGDKSPMSIVSKNLYKSDIQHPDFNLDLKAGILVLNEGKKGRRSYTSISQADIEAELAALKKA